MKIIALFACAFSFFYSGTTVAHIKREEGWFYKYLRHLAAERVQQQQPTHEKKQDGSTDSVVALVHGVQSFNRLVINQSHHLPVVVKFFSPQSPDSIKVKKNFQEVAEHFKHKVSFVAVDILENNDVFAQVTLIYRLGQIDLPLFLFYKDGQLHRPDHEPTPMIQGYFTQENLENFIQKKFSIDDKRA